MVEIQNANRALYTDIRQTLKDVAQLITRPPQALQVLREHAQEFAVGGTILALMATSGSVSINAISKPKGPNTPPQSNNKEGAEDYFFTTIPGTTVEAFQKFIKTLPDKGIGPQSHYDWPLRYQSYLAHMTRKEAKAAYKNPMVGEMVPNKMETVWFDEVDPNWTNQSSHRSTAQAKGTRTSRFDGTKIEERVPDPNWVIAQQPGSPLHLRMLSCDPQGILGYLHFTLDDPQYDYMFEQNEGRGSFIYVVDVGFDLAHQVGLLVPNHAFFPVAWLCTSAIGEMRRED